VWCWTAKEACLKSVGTGLRCDPRRLRTWGNDEPLDRVKWNDGVDASSGWHMAVTYRLATQGIALAVAAPVPIALTMHRLEWNGGNDYGLE
jgi:phosphopantetheinyl transferase